MARPHHRLNFQCAANIERSTFPTARARRGFSAVRGLASGAKPISRDTTGLQDRKAISAKIGGVPQTLCEWVKKGKVNSGVREGITSEERVRIKALEREVKELRRANEILKLASAFFAQA